jgi:hypothetical protein
VVGVVSLALPREGDVVDGVPAWARAWKAAQVAACSGREKSVGVSQRASSTWRAGLVRQLARTSRSASSTARMVSGPLSDAGRISTFLAPGCPGPSHRVRR